MTGPEQSRLLDLLYEARDHDKPSAKAQLNEWLRSDPAARQTMARLLVDEHALITKLRDDGLAAILKPVPRQHALPRPSLKKRKNNPSFLTIAALIAFGAFLIWLAIRPIRHADPQQAQVEPIAILKQEADAVWQSPSPASGGSLAPGPLNLLSGMAAIEFTSGTRILLEGPAEMTLVSEMEAKLLNGRIMAEVPPPANGFTIDTPATTIVDRGTRFGVNVARDGATLVKVMSGNVDIQTDGIIRPLPENESVSVTPAGKVTQAAVSDDAFPSSAYFSNRVARSAENNANRWSAHARILSSDPASLLNYTFEETTPHSRAARNHSPLATLESNASIVGTRWAEGRWPGSRAIEFSNRSDRILLKLKGTAQTVTCLAWVRVDSLPNPYHILLMPDASKPGALQWMIDSDGNIRMAISNHTGNPSQAASWEGPVKAPAVSNLDLGRWIFLASTYDSDSGEIIHYRDGEIIGTGLVQKPLPIQFGSFSIGNWAHGSDAVRDRPKTKGYRNFVGCMDGMAILTRALGPTEIRNLHTAGKP